MSGKSCRGTRKVLVSYGNPPNCNHSIINRQVLKKENKEGTKSALQKQGAYFLPYTVWKIFKLLFSRFFFVF